MINDSIKIILNQYKQEHITEDEAIQLIEDIYGKNNITYPYTPYWSQITYDAPDFSKFEITCNKIKDNALSY